MSGQWSISYRWEFRVNSATSLREKIADVLRRAASRIDARYSLAIQFEVAPNISRADEKACIEYGLKAMEWAVAESARAQSIEALMNAMLKEEHGAPT